MMMMMCAMSRSPVDILQFIAVVHASQGTNITNLRPDQLEHEILLFWGALMPVVGNPIIYLFCVTEYRQNIVNMWKSCTESQKEDYEEDQFLALDHHEDQMKEVDTRE